MICLFNHNKIHYSEEYMEYLHWHILYLETLILKYILFKAGKTDDRTQMENSYFLLPVFPSLCFDIGKEKFYLLNDKNFCGL